ncbi:MAG TPA: hypothetical protein VN328_09505 [Thermodesulfovibrionales bacterium]|nr:hypothetical protein [Thermodesulfovibrionales bacterium]
MGTLGAIWGITGVLLLLTGAVYRLAPLAVDAFSFHFIWYHWLSLALIVLFMAYAEGYRGFQQRFSPRVAARARYLRENPRVLYVLLAPFFCMGYFHATRRRKITSLSLTAGIIILILLMRLLPQPWRGIVDAGVVLGLVWGLVSLSVFCVIAFTSKEFGYSPEVPEERSGK